MISQDLARKFIEQVTRYTDYNVNIMDGDGIIIASIDPERVGQYHEIAHRIVTGSEDIVDTTVLTGLTNVKPGINMVIMADGRREGVVGVTGDPDEIRPVALIVKMAIETMLKYEKQQEEARLRENRKARFIHLLTEVEGTDPEDLKSMARDLGYPEEMIRIPILIRAEEEDASELLALIRKSRRHAKQDFSIAPDKSHVLIFKSMPEDCRDLFGDYKFILGEYLAPVLARLRGQGRQAHIYIGSFQSRYADYFYAYRHCRWAERNVRTDSSAVYFYDHIGEYLHQVTPFGEMAHIFRIYEQRLPADMAELFLATFGELIRTNYNFKEASDRLYIHKNTLFYRYNKLKDMLGLDPIASASDRSFAEEFYYYIRRKNA